MPSTTEEWEAQVAALRSRIKVLEGALEELTIEFSFGLESGIRPIIRKNLLAKVRAALAQEKAGGGGTDHAKVKALLNQWKKEDDEPASQAAPTGDDAPRPRCERCGWPLEADPKDGCVEGNCSMRPLPPKREGSRGAEPSAEGEHPPLSVDGARCKRCHLLSLGWHGHGIDIEHTCGNTGKAQGASSSGGGGA